MYARDGTFSLSGLQEFESRRRNAAGVPCSRLPRIVHPPRNGLLCDPFFDAVPEDILRQVRWQPAYYRLETIHISLLPGRTCPVAGLLLTFHRLSGGLFLTAHDVQITGGWNRVLVQSRKQHDAQPKCSNTIVLFCIVRAESHGALTPGKLWLLCVRRIEHRPRDMLCSTSSKLCQSEELQFVICPQETRMRLIGVFFSFWRRSSCPC